MPRRFSLQASRIHLRLDPWLLPFGVISLSGIVVENPVIVIEKSGQESDRSSSTKPPAWLHVRAPAIQLEGGIVRFDGWSPSGPDTPYELSAVKGSLDLTLNGGLFALRRINASCRAQAPLPEEMGAKGSLFLSAGGPTRFDLLLESRASKVHLRGSFAPKRRGGASLKAHAVFAPASLKEVAVGWSSAPDLLLDGHFDLTWDGPVFGWSGRCEGAGFGAVQSEGEVRASSGGTEVSGKARLEGVTPAPFWRDPRAKEARINGEADFRVFKSSASPAAWEVSAKIERSSVWDIPLSYALLQLDGTGDEGSAHGDFFSPLTGKGSGSARWSQMGEDWDTRLSAGGASLVEVLSRLGYAPSLPETIKAPEGEWAVPLLEMSRSAKGFRLKADLQHPAIGEASIDIGPVAPGLPVKWSLQASSLDPSLWGLGPRGSLSGILRFEGPAPDQGRLFVSMARSEWSSITIDPFETLLHFESGGAVVVDSATIETSAGRLSGKADYIPEKGWTAALSCSTGDLTALQPFLPINGPGGSLDAQVVVRASGARFNVSGKATVDHCSYEKMAADRIMVRGSWSGESDQVDASASWSGLSFGDSLLGGGEGAIKGSLSSAKLSLDAALGEERRFSFEGLLALNGRSGSLSVGKMEVALQDKTFAQEGPAKVLWDADHVEWSGLALRKNKSSVDLEGRIGFARKGAPSTLSGRLTARHLPLALLPLPKTAGALAGAVDADLEWRGTVAAPSLSGSARLSDGLYRFAYSDLAITPISAELKAEGDRLVLTRATATSPEGGEATASGYLQFRGFLPAAFRLEASGKGFPFVVGRDMEGVADFTVAFAGSPERPVMTGEAAILKGRIQLPDLQRQQPLPASVHFVNAPKGSPYWEQPNPGKPIVGALRGSARLTSKGDLWVSNRSLLAELSGALTVRFTDGGPVVEGTLELLNGRYLFQNIKFDIQDSRLFFKGTTDLLPYLDVNAYYRASGADISLHLTGPADHPELHLSSQPPMPQGDILSTLLFGRPSNDLSVAESRAWSASASALALQYQAAPLMESVQEGLGLDTIEIGASPTGGTQVGFSKYLGDKTVLEYRQTFGTLPESRLNLRYRMNRHISLQTESTDTGKAGLDLLWENRY
jgi:hypothetical protein